jgi:putative sterol carrier protein
MPTCIARPARTVLGNGNARGLGLGLGLGGVVIVPALVYARCTADPEGTMAAEIFTDEWAAEWHEQINANEDYRTAAARWEGAICLVMSADEDMGIPEDRAVVADLWHGDSRGAKVAGPAERDEAPYVIRASPEVWQRVLEGDVDPIVGLMGGKLKLAKGKLFSLVPYAKAAKELVVSAGRVDTSYPDGWD